MSGNIEIGELGAVDIYPYDATLVIGNPKFEVRAQRNSAYIIQPTAVGITPAGNLQLWCIAKINGQPQRVMITLPLVTHEEVDDAAPAL